MPMIQVDEVLLNTKFRVLIEQRDGAMNAVVNLQGDLAVAHARIAALEAAAAKPIQDLVDQAQAQATSQGDGNAQLP